MFYGIGGYTATLLTQNFGISPWFGMLAGAAISAAVAIIIQLSHAAAAPAVLRAGHHRHPGSGALLVIHEESWTGAPAASACR
nr:hypothetical protein [Achromobacter xylosoxidans]